MLAVVFHPDVKQEIIQSFKWYQEQSFGLGHEFVNELEASFHSIQTLPFTWPKMGQSHRRFILSRFPYSIIYKIHGNKEIYIVAVMHNQRKPGYWHKRS